MGEFWSFSWVLIPLAGIFAGMFSQWLKFKEKTTQLGASTDELERAVADIRKQNAVADGRERALVERIQNLEAIVTSQAWDTLHGDTLSEPEKQQRLANPQVQIAPPGEEDDSGKAAQLAHRLRI